VTPSTGGARFTHAAGIADESLMTDAERERAIRSLRESYARGALTNEDLDEKLDALFAARSRAELAELMPDHGDWADTPPPEIAASGSDLDTVEQHLSSAERIEWVGRPDPAKHFTRGDVFLVPFSIMWGGFSIFWEASAISGGAGPFFALWGIPFVVIGLYFIFGRFIYKARRKRRTIYAVTNRRVMTIVKGRHDESVEATYLRSIPNISTSAVSNGDGSVEFGLSSPMTGSYGNSGMEFFARGQMASSGVSFYDIEDPRGVADLVERLRDADRAR
jgi:uncharacterized membrane protein